MLTTLDPTKFLFLQLANCFSVQDSPVWMDSSTQAYCQNMEERLGGPQVGSTAYEAHIPNMLSYNLAPRFLLISLAQEDMKGLLDIRLPRYFLRNQTFITTQR